MNNEIVGNTMNVQAARGIISVYQTDMLISDNHIQNDATVSSSNTGGMTISAFQTSEISGNVVNMDSANWGIYLVNFDGTVANQAVVSNNMVHLYRTTNQSYNSGIYLTSCNYMDIVHNSVRTNFQYDVSAGTTAAASLDFNTGNSNCLIQNNIFTNQGAGLAVYMASAASLTASTMDYNNIHANSATVAYNGANRTFATWQSSSGYDANSISALPLFNSASDLHLQLTSPCINAGSLLAAYLTDIDGDTRPNPVATNPELGADETPEGGCAGPLAGVYTIGGVSPDFPSIDSAVQALIDCGISAAVTFNIRDGNYNEQVTIPAITGSSGTNWITFQSESGDSTAVTIGIASSSSGLSDNYIIEFDGVTNITFRQLGICPPWVEHLCTSI